MAGFPILSTIIFLPIFAVLIILLLPKRLKTSIKTISLVAFLLQTILILFIISKFDFNLSGVIKLEEFQFVEKVAWITVSNSAQLNLNFKIEYFLGVDGISIVMLLLSGIIFPISVAASWNIDKSPKGYFLMLNLLNSGVMGTFVALDLFLFFIFWEIMLLPMYFLIGLWGGERKEYAAIKFFLYTLFGGILLLLTIILLALSSSIIADGISYKTFNLIYLMDQNNYIKNGYLSILNSNHIRLLAFAALFVAFAIKLPIFPFHTWLPDAHVEAPTPISVILAGILLKLGGYGFIRILYPLFPEYSKEFAFYIAMLGSINVIYGALCALAQTDFKKLIAYSSISHMGYVMFGLASLDQVGVLGSVMQMFNHGIITSMLFLIVGIVYDRIHTREIAKFGGLALKAPIYTGFVTIAFFAAIGLPGLSAFISEAFCYLGAFNNSDTRLFGAISLSGVALAAGYMLWTLQRIFFGKLKDNLEDFQDLTNREIAMLIPLSFLVILFGIYPSLLIQMLNNSINFFVIFISN